MCDEYKTNMYVKKSNFSWPLELTGALVLYVK